MRAILRAIALAALIFLIALLVLAPGSAMAVKLVPPGNSAANQYTETLPGPGGNVPSSEVKGGGSPAKVLGAANAARLEALGRKAGPPRGWPPPPLLIRSRRADPELRRRARFLPGRQGSDRCCDRSPAHPARAAWGCFCHW